LSKPLAIDALHPNVECVAFDERPRPQRSAKILYAVFSRQPEAAGLDDFLGVVTERDIANYPQRIFADLLRSTPRVRPVVADTPLETIRKRMQEEKVEVLPVVTPEGKYAGLVTSTSLLEVLLYRDRAHLREIRRLHQVVEDEHRQLVAWSKKLEDLHAASCTLLNLLSHNSLDSGLLEGGIAALAKLLEARYGAIGVLGPNGELAQFVHTGITAEQAARIPNLPRGDGLLGVTIRENIALRLDDMSKDPRSAGFPANHPPMTSLLAVPISHQGHVYGRIYLCDKTSGSGKFSAEDESLALSFAHSLSLILDNAREFLEIKRAQESLHRMAHFDDLTGLPNRTLFIDRLQQAMAHAGRNGLKVGVLFVDIDNFKIVNDTHGHVVGDELLKQVGAQIKGCIRETDTAARFGGDEFMVLLTDIRDTLDITSIAQKILNTTSAPFVIDRHELFISLSVGITVYASNISTINDPLKEADIALHHAKSQGKNNFQFFAPNMNENVQLRMQMEKRLRRALKQQKFHLCFQPQIELASGRVSAVEALLRWNGDNGNVISPGEFIPVAEDTGLIVPIGEWVLQAACSQNVEWLRAGLPPLRMAVNVSAKQFRQRDFASKVSEILDRTGMDPKLLELEITESLLIQHDETTLSVLKELKALGVQFSIDDFGTGYSSLNYLRRFPISTLKIDSSFVHDIAVNPDNAAITAAIISMAHSLKFEVVAEGVETGEQVRYLAKHYCNNVQGYFFAKPMPADRFVEWWENARSAAAD